MSAEQWRPVVGYEDLYLVSDTGRVWSIPRADALGRMRGGRFLIGSSGRYSRVGLSRDGRTRIFSRHTLVLTAFVGPRPDGLQGCHNNGNPHDNRLVNLRWDTPEANAQDSLAHGTNRNAQKTHCPQGHPYDGENTFEIEGHGRQCRTCKRARDKKRRDRHRNPAHVAVAGAREVLG